MQRLFGISRNKPKPDLQQAINSTEERLDATQVKISRLDAELGRYRDQMKRMRDGPGKSAVQQRAIRVLRQKRMYEAQMEQLTQQSFNMEQSMMVTDNLRNTMATVDAMQQANKELKRTYGSINVDKIERMQDDMEDLLEQSGALQETLARSYAMPDDIDEHELEAELEALYVYMAWIANVQGGRAIGAGDGNAVIPTAHVRRVTRAARFCGRAANDTGGRGTFQTNSYIQTEPAAKEMRAA